MTPGPTEPLLGRNRRRPITGDNEFTVRAH